MKKLYLYLSIIVLSIPSLGFSDVGSTLGRHSLGRCYNKTRYVYGDKNPSEKKPIYIPRVEAGHGGNAGNGGKISITVSKNIVNDSQKVFLVSPGAPGKPGKEGKGKSSCEPAKFGTEGKAGEIIISNGAPDR